MNTKAPGPTDTAQQDKDQLDSTQQDTVQPDAVQFDGAESDTARLNAARLNAARLNAARLDDNQVIEYLKEHRDFFCQRPELLNGLQIPQSSTGASSLIERQVQQLREQNQKLRSHVNDMVENAQDNQRRFDITRELTLALVQADGLVDAVQLIKQAFQEQYQVDLFELILLSDETPRDISPEVRFNRYEEIQQIFPSLTPHTSICGLLRPHESKFVFAQQANELGSAALFCIGSEQPLALMALGSRHPERYQSNMGTLFLTQLGELLAQLLPRWLPSP